MFVLFHDLLPLAVQWLVMASGLKRAYEISVSMRLDVAPHVRQSDLKRNACFNLKWVRPNLAHAVDSHTSWRIDVCVAVPGPNFCHDLYATCCIFGRANSTCCGRPIIFQGFPQYLRISSSPSRQGAWSMSCECTISNRLGQLLSNQSLISTRRLDGEVLEQRVSLSGTMGQKIFPREGARTASRVWRRIRAPAIRL